MNHCKNCKYYVSPMKVIGRMVSAHLCTHPKMINTFDTYLQHIEYFTTCEKARDVLGKCGPEGALFKPTFWFRIFK